MTVVPAQCVGLTSVQASATLSQCPNELNLFGTPLAYVGGVHVVVDTPFIAADLPPGTGHSVRESWLLIVLAVGLVVIPPGACPWWDAANSWGVA